MRSLNVLKDAQFASSTAHFDRLMEPGIDPCGRVWRLVDARLLDEADVVAVMGLEHKACIEKKFGRPAWLFNEMAHGKRLRHDGSFG